MKLTDKRRQWAESRKAAIKGTPIRPSRGADMRYRRQLEALISLMRKDYEREIRKAYRSEGVAMDSISGRAGGVLAKLGRKWADKFGKVARKMADNFVSALNRDAKKRTELSLSELSGGLTIKTPDYNEEIQDVIRASIAQNVALIKSIPEQYHLQIEGAVMRSIAQGGTGAAEISEQIRSSKQMMEEIENYGFQAEKRAGLIARDQTSKITNTIAVERMKAAGVEEFEWVHSGGGAEPRKLHLELDGQVFRFDDPPIIDEQTGERGLPGQLINCRCIARPIISFE